MTNNFEALPIEVKNSALTEKQMGVLNVLYRMSTMETSKANADGSFFASQATLMNETGYSKNTIKDIRSNFDTCGFITTQKGTWEGRKATTYILHKDVVMEWANNHPRIGEVKQRRAKKNVGIGSVIGSVNKCPDAVNKYTDEETQTLRDEVKHLREVVNTQNQRITALEEALIKIANGSVIGSVIGSVNTNSIGSVIRNCPTESETEIEKTNHILTGSNTIENDNYRDDAGENQATFKKVEGNDPDEVAPSNEIDQTGDVCDFNKKSKEGVDTFQPDEMNNEQGEINPNGEVTQSQTDEEINKSQATANKADQSLATPQMVQLTTNEANDDQSANKAANPASGNVTLNAEERIKQLEALNLQNRNTPNVNPIELAEELGNLIVNDNVVYQSRLYNRVIALGSFLVWYANDDIDTINEIERLFMCGHIKKYGTSHPTIVSGFAGLRNEIAEMNANKTDQSLADTSDEETIIQSDKAREIANKGANPASGNTDTNPQKEDTPQASANKATEAKEKDSKTDKMLTEFVNLNAQWVAGDYQKQEQAINIMNKLANHCGHLNRIERLNWCEEKITEVLNEHGRIIAGSVEMYCSTIAKVIANRQQELLAA